MRNNISRLLLCVVVGLIAVSCKKQELHPNLEQLPEVFYKGTTTTFSSYIEDVAGNIYKDNGVATDPYISIKAHGGNMVRLSLEPEGFIACSGMEQESAPDIDWQLWSRVKRDLLRAKAAGLDVVLTLKPEKTVARRWAHIKDQTVLGDTLYNWCYSMLELMVKQQTVPKIVAIGNEINAAFMSPQDEYNNNQYNYARNVYFVNRGIEAVRAISKRYNVSIKTAVHIFSPSNITWWISKHYDIGLKDFDVLALSWYYGYPGHSMGGWRNFSHLGQYLRRMYGKDFMILETSFPFTQNNGDNQRNVYTAVEDGYTCSPADQRRWFATLANDVRLGGGLGLITWGSESLPTNAWIYADDSWGKGSSWDNNSYWKFDGELHEGIDWFSDVE